MTNDAFEAFWFLYSASRRTLSQMARKSSTRTSTLTYFHRAVRGALNRANDVDTFIKAIEQATDLDFTRHYEDPLPSEEAMEELFRELQYHGTLAFMPRLVERERERKAQFEEGEHEHEQD
jgi:hypothetical protein